MNDRMICITDSDEHRFEPSNLDHARAVEDYADNLMAECVTLAGAISVNRDHDIFDGDLLPQLMQCIARWKGSSLSAATHMHALNNLLANALQTIAEREVTK